MIPHGVSPPSRIEVGLAGSLPLLLDTLGGMKKIWISVASVLAFGALLTGCSTSQASSTQENAGQGSTSQGTIGQVGVAEFDQVVQTNGTRVIDVRTPAEYSAGHLPGAVNIDVESSSFGAEIAGLDKTATYAVYCRSGNRSKVASQQLANDGFTHIYDLAGGINAWIGAGQPVVS